MIKPLINMASTTILGLTITLTPPLLTFLRLTPLLGTTASLTHAYMEYITTTSFLSPAPTTSLLSQTMLRGDEPTTTPTNVDEVANAKEIVTPVWFVTFFNKGVQSVIGLNSITLISGSANLWLFGNGLGGGRMYYSAGLIAAAAHYLFVPLVAPSVERLFRICAAHEKGEKASKEGKSLASAVESVREWVGWHSIRMVTVDVVAWTLFAIGVTKCLHSV
jgi:hypothetical protein